MTLHVVLQTISVGAACQTVWLGQQCQLVACGGGTCVFWHSEGHKPLLTYKEAMSTLLMIMNVGFKKCVDMELCNHEVLTCVCSALCFILLFHSTTFIRHLLILILPGRKKGPYIVVCCCFFTTRTIECCFNKWVSNFLVSCMKTYLVPWYTFLSMVTHYYMEWQVAKICQAKQQCTSIKYRHVRKRLMIKWEYSEMIMTRIQMNLCHEFSRTECQFLGMTE